MSSTTAANNFKNAHGTRVAFHSFVRNDDVILDRFCDYMKWGQRSPSDIQKFAILSEDETAYGISGAKKSRKSRATEKVLEEDKSAKLTCSQKALGGQNLGVCFSDP